MEEECLENLWLTYAKRLQAVASTGLHFGRDPFDRERYKEIIGVANEMLAQIGQVPIERVECLVADFALGYPTPKVDVRGAVIENDAILLVRERSDGLWSLPGGFADIGFSPAQNIEREIFQEAGIQVTASGLYAVRHKAKRPYEADARDFYKLFFLCERCGGLAPQPGLETSEAGFFPRHRIPPLSRSRVLESDIEAAFAFRDGKTTSAAFD